MGKQGVGLGPPNFHVQGVVIGFCAVGEGEKWLNTE